MFSVARSARAWCGIALSVLLFGPGLGIGDDTAARPKNPYAGDKSQVTEGGSLFNQYCSHCHGPWAVQPERPRDLRRLNIRYGDDAIATFYSTVSNGRMDKGMPVWKGVLSDEVIWKIYTFLESVQDQD